MYLWCFSVQMSSRWVVSPVWSLYFLPPIKLATMIYARMDFSEQFHIEREAWDTRCDEKYISSKVHYMFVKDLSVHYMFVKDLSVHYMFVKDLSVHYIVYVCQGFVSTLYVCQGFVSTLCLSRSKWCQYNVMLKINDNIFVSDLSLYIIICTDPIKNSHIIYKWLLKVMLNTVT